MIHFIDESIYEQGEEINVAVYYDDFDSALNLIDRVSNGHELIGSKRSPEYYEVQVYAMGLKVRIYTLKFSYNGSRGYKHQYSFVPNSVFDPENYDFFNYITLSSTIDYRCIPEKVKDSYVPRVLIY